MATHPKASVKKLATQSKHRRGRKGLESYVDKMRARLRVIATGEHLPKLGVRQNICLDSLVNVVKAAMQNPVQLPFDTAAFSIASPARRSRLLKDFVGVGKIKDPAVLVDCKGIALVWYLPDAIPFGIQLQAFQSAKFVSSKLKGKRGESTGHWRSNTDYNAPAVGPSTPLGSETFSAAWLAQGHTSSHYPLKSSLSLRSPKTHAGLHTQWLQGMKAMDTCVNLLLSLLDKELYDLGKHVLGHLRKDSETRPWSQRWTSVFTAICVVANRVTPPHRDTKGSPRLLDVLVNTGTCTGAEIKLPELGAVFDYRPGTALAFSGKDFMHEVPTWSSGERVCYAYFMRAEVVRRFIEPSKFNLLGWQQINQ